MRGYRFYFLDLASLQLSCCFPLLVPALSLSMYISLCVCLSRSVYLSLSLSPHPPLLSSHRVSRLAYACLYLCLTLSNCVSTYLFALLCPLSLSLFLSFFPSSSIFFNTKSSCNIQRAIFIYTLSEFCSTHSDPCIHGIFKRQKFEVKNNKNKYVVL